MIVITSHAQLFNVSPKAIVGGMPGNEYNDVWGYVGSDQKEYAIIGSARAINIFDVTNCSSPVLKMQYIDGANAIWRDFKTYQGYAYAVCDKGNNRPCIEGLQIINLSNYSVHQDSSKFRAAHNIWVDEMQGRLYVAGSDAAGGPSLLIYTLDTEVVNGVTYNGTPGNPVFIHKHNTSYIHDMYAHNHMVFASHGYDGYRLWNCSNPIMPIELSSNLDNTGYNHSSYVTPDGYAYGCEELPRGKPVKIYQVTGTGLSTSLNYITSFMDPCEAPTYTNPRPHNPFVKGDTLFIAYYEDGVQIWDISNRTIPKRIAYYDTYKAQNGIGYDNNSHNWKGAWGVYPYLPSGCIIVGDITQGLFTFKVSIPPSTPNTVSDLDKVDGNLLINDYTKGLILRNSEGYCYRIKVANNGQLSSQQVICHVNSQQYIRTYTSDIGFSNSTKGLILKSPNGTCYKLYMNGNTLATTAVSTCNPSSNTVTTNSDIVIESAGKGVILSNSTNCFRISISETGEILTTLLNECE
jgi:choice-of-anchor B domain-containing protein